MKSKARAFRNRIPPAFGRLALLTAILLLGFALRVVRFTADRFHADEALYTGWALLTSDGDPLLLSVPVDKPPLFLYTLSGSTIAFGRSEVAARLPSLASSMLGIAILYRLGQRLYAAPGCNSSAGRRLSADCGSSYDRWSPGLLATLFLALSPFDLLFARTAFTDSMLVLWMLVALWAVAAGRWFTSGIALGLAFATKQHSVFLIPLVVATGWVTTWQARDTHRAPSPPGLSEPTRRVGKRAKELLTCTLGFSLPFAGVVAWDSARWSDRPGYWQQSASSYGGLMGAPFAEWGERLVEWIGWARYLAGSRVLGFMIVLGIVFLMVYDWQRKPGTQQTWLDTLFVAYGTGFVLVHTVLQFSIWDRYLLPLAPLLALLLARIVVQIGQLMRRGTNTATTRSPHSEQVCDSQAQAGAPRTRREQQTLSLDRVLGVPLTGLFLLLTLLSAWTAAQNGYPIGGEHWAYQGLDEVTAYLKQYAPPDAVLYHHWLHWHYTYYLYDATFELRWWASGEHLQREALRTPDRAQYIVLPDWRTLEPDLQKIALHPIYEAHRQDGSVSLTVYRLEPRQLAFPVNQAEKGSE
jgi:hypothetical protein